MACCETVSLCGAAAETEMLQRQKFQIKLIRHQESFLAVKKLIFIYSNYLGIAYFSMFPGYHPCYWSGQTWTKGCQSWGTWSVGNAGCEAESWAGWSQRSFQTLMVLWFTFTSLFISEIILVLAFFLMFQKETSLGGFQPGIRSLAPSSIWRWSVCSQRSNWRKAL